MKSYLIAAGGTGGHIYPGLAIAEKIKEKEKNAVIVFCGTEKGMENKLVKEEGYELLHISASGFTFSSPVKLIKAVRDFLKGRKQCMEILKSRNIDVVVGTGGYVCAPALSAAFSLKIKTLIHEQNLYPGKVNRLFAPKAGGICISYEESRKYLSEKSRIFLTGNPVRGVFHGLTREKARKILKIDPSEKILYVTGGSLGARSINNAVLQMTRNYLSLGFRIIHSVGSNDYQRLLKERKLPKGMYDIREYVKDQHLYMASADLILSRAGAITCSEIALLGKASIMVPYPYAAGDHQTSNAGVFQAGGAGIMIKDDELDCDRLYEAVSSLMGDKEKIKDMERQARKLAFPEAGDSIYEALSDISNRA